MTTYGTSYFPSLRKARDYYRDQYIWRGNVLRKIEAGEIHIGKPPLKPGERLVLLDNSRRYGIES